jgi:hypothetical protein
MNNSSNNLSRMQARVAELVAYAGSARTRAAIAVQESRDLTDRCASRCTQPQELPGDAVRRIR